MRYFRPKMHSQHGTIGSSVFLNLIEVTAPHRTQKMTANIQFSRFPNIVESKTLIYWWKVRNLFFLRKICKSSNFVFWLAVMSNYHKYIFQWRFEVKNVFSRVFYSDFGRFWAILTPCVKTWFLGNQGRRFWWQETGRKQFEYWKLVSKPMFYGY